MYMSGQFRHATGRLLPYLLRAQKPRPNLRPVDPQVYRSLYHRQRHSSLAESSSNLTSSIPVPVPSLIIAELAKANIRCTTEGVEMLEEAYASTSESILYDAIRFSKRFRDAWMASDIDFNSLYSIQDSPESPWRPNEQAFIICVNSKVYKMWEALYSSSTVFRHMIDQEERYTELFERKNPQIYESDLWNWMFSLIEEGVVNRQDIENLPDPVDLSKLGVAS